MLSPHDAHQRFCELIASRGGSPEHPDPAITWAAFLEFVELPVAYGEPPGPLDADMLPVDLLIDEGEILVSFARNMFRPWSEAFSGDPINVGASFRYALTPELQDIRELALSGIAGPIEDSTGPLFRPGVDRPSVAPGRLAEAVDAHPDFARVLASSPRAAMVYVDDPAEDGD